MVFSSLIRPTALLVVIFVVLLKSEYGALRKVSDSHLSVAAFNIQNFGKNKMEKEDVVGVLIKILSRYDIVLIQEIVDREERAIDQLLEELNKSIRLKKDRFDMVVGPRVGRSVAKEQYAYLFRKRKVKLLEAYTFEDEGDVFERDPYVAIFQPTDLSAMESFALVGIHTKPTDAVRELQQLIRVAEHIESTSTKEVILFGDFNGDCDYVRKKYWKTIPLRTQDEFIWLIADKVDTTTTPSVCAYDRIVVTGEVLPDTVVEHSARPFNFDEAFGLDEYLTRNVSDHYPVEFQMKLRFRRRPARLSSP